MSYIGNKPNTPTVTGPAVVSTQTATGGQTSFTVAYTAGFLTVYQNGICLIPTTDYTATNGTTCVLIVGATVGDELTFVAGQSQSENAVINATYSTNATNVATLPATDNNSYYLGMVPASGAPGNQGVQYNTSLTINPSTGAISLPGITAVVNATDASSTTTASLKTAGGLGVVKNAYIGADLNVAGTTTLATSLTGIAKVTSGVVSTATSGTDIKTVNGTTLLGSGDVAIVFPAAAYQMNFTLYGGL